MKGLEQEVTLHPGIEGGAFPSEEICPGRVAEVEWRWELIGVEVGKELERKGILELTSMDFVFEFYKSNVRIPKKSKKCCKREGGH